MPPRNLSMEITPDVILEGRKLNVACKSTATDDKTFIYGEISLLIIVLLVISQNKILLTELL